MSLSKLGWSNFFAQAASAVADDRLRPARVSAVNRGGFLVWDAEGEWPASLTGRFRHQAQSGSGFPVTGDWVLVQSLPDEEKVLIHHRLPRRTALSRVAAGDATERQVLAANVDTIFVAASLSSDLNLRTIERYLTAVSESGAQPVLLLTKADLCPDLEAALAQVKTIARDFPIVPLSTISGKGMRKLSPWLKPATTSALIGPSGVGKSTLINALYKEEILPTIPVREKDQKGRHTTTLRELIYLPSGALIIDTPGMRELQLWEGQLGLDETFTDIEDLAARCRFGNCQHNTEPGCAVRQALESGQLENTRFASYLKLQKEIDHFAVRRDARTKADERRKAKLLTRTFPDRLREKGR